MNDTNMPLPAAHTRNRNRSSSLHHPSGMSAPAASGLGKARTWIPMVETACGQVLSFEQPFEVQKAKQKMLELLSHAREAGYEVTRQSYHTFDV